MRLFTLTLLGASASTCQLWQVRRVTFREQPFYAQSSSGRVLPRQRQERRLRSDGRTSGLKRFEVFGLDLDVLDHPRSRRDADRVLLQQIAQSVTVD